MVFSTGGHAHSVLFLLFLPGDHGERALGTQRQRPGRLGRSGHLREYPVVFGRRINGRAHRHRYAARPQPLFDRSRLAFSVTSANSRESRITGFCCFRERSAKSRRFRNGAESCSSFTTAFLQSLATVILRLEGCRATNTEFSTGGSRRNPFDRGTRARFHETNSSISFRPGYPTFGCGHAARKTARRSAFSA